MPHRYTDVDRLILDRWQEVSGLREAFDELLDRMEDVLGDTLAKVAVQAQERGLSCDFTAKDPSIWFWKKEWEGRGKEPGISILIKDFAPALYGRVRDEQPWCYLDISEAGKLRVKDRLAFGHAIRAKLAADTRAKWEASDTDLDVMPLGINYREVKDVERVGWMAEPGELLRFLVARLDEAQEIVPAVDKALAAVIR